MQRERHSRDESINSRGPFDGPRGFASHRSMMSGILGGRDPFDDPFFNRPFEGMFGPSIFDTHGPSDLPYPSESSSKGLVIEEIDTDDEEEEGKNGASRSATSGKEEVKKDVRFNGNHNRMEGTKPQTQSISYKKVTYGGINGAYYTATTTRKSGSDGVVLEDSKEANKTTGRATHRISKGIHDKGHSVTRNLGTDGKVDTVQTLHNLDEDELAGFEQAWKGTADMHIPGWNEEFNTFGRAGSGSMRPFGLALESADRSHSNQRVNNDNATTTSSSGGRPKKVVTINID
ncbi:uncharacterized protein LOC112527008 isoform X2 [Cynara cardunculus var. scolymus]|uniref:uncharacterized protein LOC112527008 isoform X2 n=1 Tax=Cynara cardunculus var. scolymus TaxID=59895 RepID=UPI000D627783|nr:uncharacterized protein LOC112527008 isoform X2 [Cynara cardunculus var. scolymus]